MLSNRIVMEWFRMIKEWFNRSMNALSNGKIRYNNLMKTVYWISRHFRLALLDDWLNHCVKHFSYEQKNAIGGTNEIDVFHYYFLRTSEGSNNVQPK